MSSDNLKAARKAKGLSQEEVALVLGTSRSNISKYECGQLEPNLVTLRKLCKIYNISSDKLLDIDLNTD